LSNSHHKFIPWEFLHLTWKFMRNWMSFEKIELSSTNEVYLYYL
jgi:hypothetical protein